MANWLSILQQKNETTLYNEYKLYKKISTAIANCQLHWYQSPATRKSRDGKLLEQFVWGAHLQPHHCVMTTFGPVITSMVRETWLVITPLPISSRKGQTLQPLSQVFSSTLELKELQAVPETSSRWLLGQLLDTESHTNMAISITT